MKSNLINFSNPMIKLLISSLIFFSVAANAEQWRSCDVYNSLASQREAAIAFGKLKTRVSFFRKQDFASVTIFVDGQTFGSADLIPTGRRLYSDGKPFNGFADRSKKIIVQEFENSDDIIVTSRGDVEITMFAKCRR
jgi:hypothetical protein